MTTGIKTNEDGTLELDVLTDDDIAALLDGTGIGKGQYKHTLTTTVGQGEYYVDFCKVFNKTVKTMAQSVKLNLDELLKDPAFPRCKIAKSDDKLLVINMDVRAERLAAAEAAKNEAK